MVYVLNLLREYIIRRKQILECGDQIIFGDLAWHKAVETNYIVWGSGKNGVPKEYYTLETILFLLSNDTLSHPEYVQKAAAEHVPCIRRANRKDLLKYMRGLSATSPHVDKIAPCALPIKVRLVTEEPRESTVKKSKFDDEIQGLNFNVPLQTSEKYDNIKRPGLRLLMNFLKSIRDSLSDTDNTEASGDTDNAEASVDTDNAESSMDPDSIDAALDPENIEALLISDNNDDSMNSDIIEELEIPLEVMSDPAEFSESEFKKPMSIDAYLAARFNDSTESTLSDDIVRLE